MEMVQPLKPHQKQRLLYNYMESGGKSRDGYTIFCPMDDEAMESQMW